MKKKKLKVKGGDKRSKPVKFRREHFFTETQERMFWSEIQRLRPTLGYREMGKVLGISAMSITNIIRRNEKNG